MVGGVEVRVVGCQWLSEVPCGPACVIACHGGLHIQVRHVEERFINLLWL